METLNSKVSWDTNISWQTIAWTSLTAHPAVVSTCTLLTPIRACEGLSATVVDSLKGTVKLPWSAVSPVSGEGSTRVGGTVHLSGG
mmetsp:Transcript_18389/g.31223  ORF Transcript_18389/g.31223 Transcript_18389/m.31223 type:complete len:86 (+) Transcript_18389:30-287(+)